MDNLQPLSWSPHLICLHALDGNVRAVAGTVYARVCRTTFDAPGFCILNVGGEIESSTFRKLMVDLKNEMAAIHENLSKQTLHYLSAARFDQQTSTKPHLDGGPEECFLMLGYEPSDVDSEVEISDYAKCAFDVGLSPKEFMAKHNPMLQAGYELLRPYSTRIPCFSPGDYQIICVNNSSAAYFVETPAWLGTLHTATIPSPDESKRRVINSTMIASASLASAEPVSAADQQEFVSTSLVHRRGYDKKHLDDDT